MSVKKSSLQDTTVAVFSLYYRKIVAHRDFKVASLESATSTKITIPVSAAEGTLTIIGEDAIKIVEARHQVHSIVDHIRNSHRPMQFISIPTVSEEIKTNFERFKVSRGHQNERLMQIGLLKRARF